MAEATHDITDQDRDLLRAIHHESQQSRRGVHVTMCAVLSNCTTSAQREALVQRLRYLLGPPLRLLRVDADDHERVWLTLDGRQVIQSATDSVARCEACGSAEGEHHAPECPAVNAFEAGRIAGTVDHRPDDAEPGEPVDLRFCSRCGYTYTLPGEVPPFGDLCDYCRVSYSQQPETLVEGSGPHRVEVTTLQVAIHPPGTYYEDPGTILLTIEDEGHGPYVAIRGRGDGRPGGVPVEIESLATLDALRAEAARLLCQVRIGEDE